jgi:serine/threonine protein kinase
MTHISIKAVKDELSLLSRCVHENITKYHESIVVGTKLWVVMDFSSGGSVRHLLKSGLIPEYYLQIIVSQVLNALVYLHTKVHIIHRDIKGLFLIFNK